MVNPNDPERIRAQFLIMSAIEASRDEGFTHVDIPALWGGVLCPYMTWDNYHAAVESLWNAGAFKVEGERIVIRRGKK